MLTPESFAVCFIALIVLAFFMNENRHEENMEKIEQENLMNKMNFIVLHRLDNGNSIALLASSIVGFSEHDDTHASTVYFNNTSIEVQESFDRISNMLKNIAITNIDWTENKSRFNWAFVHDRN